MASSRGRRGKRSFTLAEVIRKLDESDEEVCDDSDTDRDSNYQVSDVERDSDVVSHVSESERESVADVASDAGDSGSDVQQDVASTSTRTEWVPVTDNYVSPADIVFTATAGIVQPCDLTADSMPIDFFQLFFLSTTVLLTYLLMRPTDMPRNTSVQLPKNHEVVSISGTLLTPLR